MYKDGIFKMKSYILIEFISDSSNDKRMKSVDCVPSNWIFYDEEERTFRTPFLPPPYTIKRCQQFHDIVKAKKDPDSKWFTCTITIKGQADSYEEALQRLDRLKNENYAFTTDCDSDCIKQVDEISQQIMFKNKRKKQEIDNILKKTSSSVARNMVSINSSESESNDANYGREISTSRKRAKPFGKRQTSKGPSITSMENVSTPIIIKESHAKTDQPSTSSNAAEYISTLETQESSTVTEEKMEYMTLILKKLNNLEYCMKALQKCNKDISNKLDEILSNNINTPIENVISKDIRLPFSTIDEFYKFSKLLEEKEEYRHFFAKSINISIDNNLSISRNIVIILRKYFTKDVLIQFTAVKKIKNKHIFIETYFCKQLFDKFINRADFNVTERSFQKALGNVICNAKDWNLRRTVTKRKIPDAGHDEEKDNENKKRKDNTEHIEEINEKSEEI